VVGQLNRKQRRDAQRARRKKTTGKVNGVRQSRPLQGHPATIAAVRRGPDERELRMRELIRLVRGQAEYSDSEHPIVGLLGAAAKAAAPIVAAYHGLDEDPEHVEAIANYLTEQLGAAIDLFDITAYRDWRQAQNLPPVPAAPVFIDYAKATA
jgi:hypothetical protein